jgi:hypothetical protein
MTLFVPKPWLLSVLIGLLEREPGAEYERAFVRETLGAIEARRDRTAVNAPGVFRRTTTRCTCASCTHGLRK